MGKVSDISGGRKREADQRDDAGDEARAETEAQQKAEREAEEKARAQAVQQLALPIGGIAPDELRVQVTGGGVPVPAAKAGKLQKDQEVEVVVRGWVKTVKETTAQKGGRAFREAIVVTEEVEVR